MHSQMLLYSLTTLYKYTENKITSKIFSSSYLFPANVYHGFAESEDYVQYILGIWFVQINIFHYIAHSQITAHWTVSKYVSKLFVTNRNIYNHI